MPAELKPSLPRLASASASSACNTISSDSQASDDIRQSLMDSKAMRIRAKLRGLADERDAKLVVQNQRKDISEYEKDKQEDIELLRVGRSENALDPERVRSAACIQSMLRQLSPRRELIQRQGASKNLLGDLHEHPSDADDRTCSDDTADDLPIRMMGRQRGGVVSPFTMRAARQARQFRVQQSHIHGEAAHRGGPGRGDMLALQPGNEEEAREDQTGRELRVESDDILRVAKDFELPRLLAPITASRASRQKAKVTELSSLEKWQHALNLAEDKDAQAHRHNQLTLDRAQRGHVGPFAEVATYYFDLAHVKRRHIAGRILTFRVIVEDDELNDNAVLPGLMVSTVMEPIEVQPATQLVPYGYMWLGRGQFVRGAEGGKGAGGSKTGVEAVVEIRPDDPDVIDVGERDDGSHGACAGMYYLGVFSASKIDGCAFKVGVSARACLSESGAAGEVAASYLGMAQLSRCIRDTTIQTRLFRMQRPARLDLSFGWCGASHGAQEASAEAALNAAQGMQFKTPLAEAFIRKHHYLHQGNRRPPWHGPSDKAPHRTAEGTEAAGGGGEDQEQRTFFAGVRCGAGASRSDHQVSQGGDSADGNSNSNSNNRPQSSQSMNRALAAAILFKSGPPQGLAATPSLPSRRDEDGWERGVVGLKALEDQGSAIVTSSMVVETLLDHVHARVVPSLDAAPSKRPLPPRASSPRRTETLQQYFKVLAEGASAPEHLAAVAQWGKLRRNVDEGRGRSGIMADRLHQLHFSTAQRTLSVDEDQIESAHDHAEVVENYEVHHRRP